MEPDLERLGRLARERRERLHLRQDQLSFRGGPSTTTQSKVENAIGPAPTQRTKEKLEKALRWETGSVDLILAGSDPIELPPLPNPRLAEPPSPAPSISSPSLADLEGGVPSQRSERPTADRLMDTVVRYDAARAEVNRLEWEYSRLRGGLEIGEASDELDEVIEMLHDRRAGRPWTPPWDPSVADVYGPDAEPWSATWWRFREALRSGQKDPSTVSRPHQYGLDRPGIPENPLAQPASTSEIQRDSLYMNVYDEWAELEQRLERDDVSISQNEVVDASIRFANRVQQLGVTEHRLQFLAWIAIFLAKTGSEVADTVADVEARVRGDSDRLTRDTGPEQDQFHEALRAYTNDLYSASALAEDYELAARDLGDEPVGRKVRRAQDEAGELPDPEGPEDGA